MNILVTQHGPDYLPYLLDIRSIKKSYYFEKVLL